MKKIWIVDDDEDMAHAVMLMLKLLGCETRHFLTARVAGRAIIDGQRPDLFILDVNMPEVNGIMMLEFIRQHPSSKGLPVIMLSSEAADLQVEVAMGKGADGYITKPVSLEELDAALKAAFNKRNVKP